MVKHGRWCAAALLVGVASCDLGTTVVPRTDPQLEVHAILVASAASAQVLVEQSLTGASRTATDTLFDPANVIQSSGGIPVIDAVVTLTDQAGLVRTATQSQFGLYVINMGSSRIQPGARYTLSVTAQGRTVTGSTVVPAASPPVAVPTIPFNRDGQAVNLSIADIGLARAYWVRIDAPESAYSIFTLDRTLAIAGDTRNIYTQDLLKVFYPGFLQTVTVAAVDSNVYDYYRSGNDPFSGRGLINHLSGGLGLFGAIAVIDERQLNVTQDSTGDPIEGRYTLRSGPPGHSPPSPDGVPSEMTLFLESRGHGAPDQISGSQLRGSALAPTRAAVLGTRSGDSIDLRFLVLQDTHSVNWYYDGTARGDSLIGSVSGYFGAARFTIGRAIYVKAGR